MQGYSNEVGTESRSRPGTSGKLVIVLIAVGLLLVASVTLALYFATRQVEEESPSTPLPPNARLGALESSASVTFSDLPGDWPAISLS